MKILALIYSLFIRFFKRGRMILLKPLFRRTGRNFIFDPNSIFSYSTIEVGNDVYIGPGATLTASESSIIIGNKVMFGPNVTIMGGDHNTTRVGEYMFDVKEKLPENDLPVIINDDVWLGTGCIILKGTTIGQGAIVAAGALVISDVPEYSIVGGIPAKVLKMRFSKDELQAHKDGLAKQSK